MYARSELYGVGEGAPRRITHSELAAKIGEIPGNIVNLKPLTPDDASPYFELIAYDRAHLTQYGDSTGSKYQTVDDVLFSLEQPQNRFKLRFGIWREGVMVGSANIKPLLGKRAELGYWIGKAHTGHGYAREATGILVDFAFTTLGYDEVEAEAVDENVASIKTLEGSGFEFMKYRPYEYIDDDGKRVRRIYAAYLKKKPQP